MKLSRREMIQATAAAMALPALPQSPTPNPQFFTPAEFALVDELSDMIIPADAQSGGARAAGVAAYIDARLAEAFEPEPQDASAPSPGGRGGQGVRTKWRAGLNAVEDLSRQLSGKAFLDSTAEQRLAVLTRMAAGESDPKTPAEQFFGEIKGATIGAYYTSKVGIHDDQRYKGNVYQTGDYAGSDAT